MSSRLAYLDPVRLGFPAFVEELKKYGFLEGKNLTIEKVRTDQDSKRLG